MKTAYPLFTISFLTILFYSLSVALVRLGLLSKPNHRKFWNLLLLITFMSAGLIGLLMVVKINYKLDIPFYDEILGYHVDFGIAMVVIGLFHFWWHLKYYLRLFKSEKSNKSSQTTFPEGDLSLSCLKISAFILGGTSMIAQVILLREFLSVFNGNELVVGLVLANWMVLTGTGAILGKHQLNISKDSEVILTGLLILSVLPLITTFLINYLKNRIFPIGAMIDVFQMFIASLFLLIPFCLLSGFLFTYISRSYSEIRMRNEIGAVYGFESAGSIAGGLLSGLIFIFLFSSVESLLVMAILNGLSLFYLCSKNGLIRVGKGALITAVLAFSVLFFQPENRIRKWVYPNQEVVVSKDSPYGNIVISRRENLWSVYNNNILQFDSENFMQSEEAVHFPMIQHHGPSNVLLVSGDLSAQIAELKKYELLSVDYVEDNKWLMALLKDSIPKITTNGVTIYQSDPLRFIRRSTKTYDVVILNLPAPSTLQANRFFTLEFFTHLKEKLTQDAILSFGLPSQTNYMNNEAIELNSTVVSTLKKVFHNVIIIPGEKNYFLASDFAVNYNITRNIQVEGIKTRYVNQDYFDDSLLKRRGEMILSSLNPSSKINQNLKPVLYQQELAYWLSYSKEKYIWLLVLTTILAIIMFFSGRTPSKIMFLTGFSAAAMEIILLFGLQIYFGNIYLLSGFVFTGFMLGLTAGSFLGRSINLFSNQKYLKYNQLLIGIFTASSVLLLFSAGMENLPSAIVYPLFIVTTVITGSLTGFQFTKASLIQTGKYSEISGLTYSYDLFGSAAGALVLTIYLVPQLGIVASGILIGFLNILLGIFVTLRKN